MKLLVTGGAGFIGSNFIHYWMERHPADEILNVDKLTYAGNLDNLKGVDKLDNYTFVQMDICDPKMENSIKWCDIVVHFAAETHVDNSLESADAFIKTNVNGTYNILKYVQKYDKRMHHISTDEVFGSLPLGTDEKFSENTPYSPRNPYSVTKAAADYMVRCFHDTYGTKITISNCSNNYGPRQHIEKMIPKAITNILQGKTVPVYGTGENVRDWLHVTEHCRAVEAIIYRGRIGETYCVGGMDEGISNLQLVETMADMLQLDSKDCIKFVKDRAGHDLKYAVNWNKINGELGWSPTLDFETNLADTIQWYRENRWWWNE